MAALPRLSTATGGECVAGDRDLAGQVLLPSFVESHAHLDKALTASRAGNAGGDLAGAIGAMEAITPSLTSEDIAARAEAAIRIQLGYGTTSIPPARRP
jgi:cytosine deaminase